MRTLSLDELRDLCYAVQNIYDDATDTCCGDPDCCGGPLIAEEQIEADKLLLNSYGLDY